MSNLKDPVQTNSRQSLEKAYLERFNKVAQLDKEKNIKFFQSVGDPTFTEENERTIIAVREEYTVDWFLFV